MTRGQTVGEWIEQVQEEGLENASNRYYSIYPARVVAETTDNQPGDADAQQQGRVKVCVGSLGFTDEHPLFCYPVSPYAGSNYGFYFPAHADSPVWVTFDQGDANVARVVGSWWPNKGAELKPETSHVPTEFCKADGTTPTARGIKTKGGHVLLFEDDPENYFVELSTGANATKEEQEKDEAGNPIGTRTVIDVAKKSGKRHRIRLDDTNEEIVIATFGEDPNAEAGGEGESGRPADQTDADEFAERNRHAVTMRDKSDDRFVQMKTIGADESTFHELLMSDTDELICLSSADIHFMEINDKDDKISVVTAGGFQTVWDEMGKTITTETMGGNKLTMDDNAMSNELLTASAQSIKQEQAGTTINDPVGKVDVIATSASTHTYAAALTRSIGSSFTDTIGAAMTLTVGQAFTATVAQATTWLGQAFSWTGTTFTMLGTAITMTAPAVQILSANILAGTGANQPLVNLTGAITFNTHTHLVVGALPGFAVPTFSPMIPGNDTTVALLGA